VIAGEVAELSELVNFRSVLSDPFGPAAGDGIMVWSQRQVWHDGLRPTWAGALARSGVGMA